MSDRSAATTASTAVNEILAALAEGDADGALRVVAQAVDEWRRVAHAGMPVQQEAWLAEPARLDELPPPWRVLMCGVVREWAHRWHDPAPAWTAVEPLPEPWSPLGHRPGDHWWARAEQRPVQSLRALGIVLESSWFETA